MANKTTWSPLLAKEVISDWQRVFTESLYNHKLNFELNSHNGKSVERRIVHPLASTSISDMLAEFCDFNYRIIFAGYFLMVGNFFNFSIIFLVNLCCIFTN